ncbi:MAG: S8 family serine peptidase, partial [Bdellovibrionales bacterium]|nr:S8 family serine peptidase [Bdellovibrionales bacterium]
MKLKPNKIHLTMIALGFFVFQSVFVNSSGQAESLDLKNFSEISKPMGFQTHYAEYVTSKKNTVKIAILGSSFQSYDVELGKTIPSGTVFHTPPLPADEGEEDSLSQHGLYMAQLLVKLMTDNNQKKELEPELHLFPYVYKYSNFKWAIEEAIKQKVDIILYSTVKDFGGNNDGKGFINSLVNKALDAGILWVNAAGNYGQTTYNASIETVTGDWVKLPGPNNTVGIECKPIRDLKECHLRLTLSWNDFKDNTDVGTDKDLDLVLSDDALNIFENNRGALIQKKDPKSEETGVSKYPREIIEINLKEGLYFARIKNMSHNFSSRDQLRLVGDGDGISFVQSNREESLLNPADNAGVITVGATDTDKSS